MAMAGGEEGHGAKEWRIIRGQKADHAQRFPHGERRRPGIGTDFATPSNLSAHAA